MASAAAGLSRALLDRYHHLFPHPAAELTLPAPVVVSLGPADVLQWPDPVRAHANVHLTAQEILLGPWGGTAACGHCLGVRWQRLRPRTEREALETGADMRGVGDWPVLTDFAVDAAWDVYQAVMAVPGAGRVVPRVTALRLTTLRTASFPLLADPLCPTCPPPVESPIAPLLRSRTKPAPDRYRQTRAEDLALSDDALVNPVCGVLSAGSVLNLASPTTAPVTGSVFVRSYAGLIDMSWSGQADSYAASRQLSLLEGLERYAGTHRRRATAQVFDSYDALRGIALDPADCGFYAPETYREDDDATPFSAYRKMPWVWGWSLRDERPILVPRRLCHYSTGEPADGFVFATSSGCAVGSCLEEAILFGLLELIERDAFLLGWYGGARLTEIDLASCRGAKLRAMVDRAHLHGYDVHAYDNRIDLAVPVATALAVRRDGGPGALSFAAGASLDPETAVESALGEVLTYIPQMPGQVVRRRAELEAMADDYTKVRHLADHSALFGLPRMVERAGHYLDRSVVSTMSELYPGGSEGLDLLDDLRHVQRELTRAGCDVIVVDQTTPDQELMGLRSVCTIAPGLLPIDFGWSRQRALRLPRLRTAFRRAGLRTTDLTDAEVHRVPHPFP